MHAWPAELRLAAVVGSVVLEHALRRREYEVAQVPLLAVLDPEPAAQRSRGLGRLAAGPAARGFRPAPLLRPLDGEGLGAQTPRRLQLPLPRRLLRLRTTRRPLLRLLLLLLLLLRLLLLLLAAGGPAADGAARVVVAACKEQLQADFREELGVVLVLVRAVDLALGQPEVVVADCAIAAPPGSEAWT